MIFFWCMLIEFTHEPWGLDMALRNEHPHFFQTPKSTCNVFLLNPVISIYTDTYISLVFLETWTSHDKIREPDKCIRELVWRRSPPGSHIREHHWYYGRDASFPFRLQHLGREKQGLTVEISHTYFWPGYGSVREDTRNDTVFLAYDL